MAKFEENRDRIQIVVFGFNRLDKIQSRLKELRDICPGQVHVSIDWSSDKECADFRKLLEFERATWPENSKLSFFIHETNQGMVSHITKTISRILEEFDSVIVIEDDVPVSRIFIDFASKALLMPDFSSTYASVGGFSLLNYPPSFRKRNRYRESPYFYCWGWGTTKEIWRHYKSNLQNEKLDESLQGSKVWAKLGKKQKETWIGRFSRLQINPNHTWDVQFQYLSFKFDKLNLLPVARVTENEGFGSLQSTHTKNKRPWWLGKPHINKNPISQEFANRLIQNLIVWVESYTIAGDRKLNPKVHSVIRRIKA